MKKVITIILTIILVAIGLTGCTKEAEKKFPTDEEIMENMSVYLEKAQLQDPAAYPTKSDFYMANLGLSDKEISDAVLYMGAPNQNTTFFLMVTKAENADENLIDEKLENKMKSHIQTAEMGYMTGSTEYDIIKKENKIFVIVHEEPESFTKMQTYLNSL